MDEQDFSVEILAIHLHRKVKPPHTKDEKYAELHVVGKIKTSNIIYCFKFFRNVDWFRFQD